MMFTLWHNGQNKGSIIQFKEAFDMLRTMQDRDPGEWKLKEHTDDIVVTYVLQSDGSLIEKERFYNGKSK